MKRIKKDELFRNVDGFLKTKGVELKPGSYTDRIQRVCGLLSDVINASQSGLERAKAEAEKRLDHVRQTIHEKTAPKASSTPSASATSAPPPTSNTKKPGVRRARKPAVRKRNGRPQAKKNSAM